MQASGTPMDFVRKLGIEQESLPVEKGKYQHLVRKLIYLSATHPNIGFPVGVGSQFMNNPREDHQEVVYQNLIYLIMTSGKGLFVIKIDDRDIVFTYTDWAMLPANTKSTASYCTYVQGNHATWQSKK